METKFDMNIGTLPLIIVTNASGFIGRNLLDHFKDNFRILAISKISQGKDLVPHHPNIKWIHKELNRFKNIEDLATEIYTGEYIECVIHLTESEKQFQKKNHNVLLAETKNILELAKLLNAKQFLFESSLDVYKINKRIKAPIMEDSPTTGNTGSFVSCEELVKKYSRFFKCNIIRTANVYSDWCENPTLYAILRDGVSGYSYNANTHMAYNYIHIKDLLKLFFQVIRKENNLDSINHFIACSPDSVTNKEILKTLSYLKSVNIKKNLRVRILAFVYKHTSIKKKGSPLKIDNSFTRRKLDWNTTRRYDLLRRLYVLASRSADNNNEWHHKNEPILPSSLSKNTETNFFLLSPCTITGLKNKLNNIILDPFNGPRFNLLQSISVRKLDNLLEKFFTAFTESINLSDHIRLLDYAGHTAGYLYRNESNISEFRALLRSFYSLLTECPEYIALTHSKKNMSFERILYLLECASDRADECYEEMNKISITNLSEDQHEYLSRETVFQNSDEKKGVYQTKSTEHLRTKIFLN